MNNAQLKFEGKIEYGSKVVAFTRNYTSFKANLNLKVKVKVTRFSNPNFLFVGQFDLKGQGHKFLE